jgi:hypothetical protein
LEAEVAEQDGSKKKMIAIGAAAAVVVDEAHRREAEEAHLSVGIMEEVAHRAGSALRVIVGAVVREEEVLEPCLAKK